MREGASIEAGDLTSDGIPELEQAVELARSVGSPSCLTWPLSVLGMFLANLDPPRAEPILADAIDACRLVGNRHALVGALWGTAWVHYRNNDLQRACQAFADTVEISVEIGDATTFPIYMYQLSSLLGELGESEPGAVLRGAADALRLPEEFRPPFLIEWGERTAGAMTADIGEERFLNLIRRGAAMTPGQAARYAREQADAITRTS
jgi:hypothetical protein